MTAWENISGPLVVRSLRNEHGISADMIDRSRGMRQLRLEQRNDQDWSTSTCVEDQDAGGYI